MAFSFGNPGSGNLGGDSTGGGNGRNAQLGPELEDIQTTVHGLFQDVGIIIVIANKITGA